MLQTLIHQRGEQVLHRVDFQAGWKVLLCTLVMCLGSGLWETLYLTSAAYAASALAVQVNVFWIRRLFTFSLNVDLLSASMGNLTWEVIGPAICPKGCENSWFGNTNGDRGHVQPLHNLLQIIAKLLGFPTRTHSLRCSLSKYRLRGWDLWNECSQHPFPMVTSTKKHVVPALSSSALICIPFWRINHAPVKQSDPWSLKPGSRGGGKQQEWMGTPVSSQHFLQVNINPCVSHRQENGVISRLMGSLFQNSSGPYFSTVQHSWKGPDFLLSFFQAKS